MRPALSVFKWVFISFCVHVEQTLGLLLGENFGELLLPAWLTFLQEDEPAGSCVRSGASVRTPRLPRTATREHSGSCSKEGSQRLSSVPLARLCGLHSVLALCPLGPCRSFVQNCVSASKFISHSVLQPSSGWNFWASGVAHTLPDESRRPLPVSCQTMDFLSCVASGLQKQCLFGGGIVEVFRKGVKIFLKVSKHGLSRWSQHVSCYSWGKKI